MGEGENNRCGILIERSPILKKFKSHVCYHKIHHNLIRLCPPDAATSKARFTFS